MLRVSSYNVSQLLLIIFYALNAFIERNEAPTSLTLICVLHFTASRIRVRVLTSLMYL